MKKFLLLLTVLTLTTPALALLDDGGAGNSNEEFQIPVYAKNIITLEQGSGNDILRAENEGELLVLKRTKPYEKIMVHSAIFGGISRLTPAGIKRFVVNVQKTDRAIILKTISLEEANNPPYYDPINRQVMVDQIGAPDGGPYLMQVKSELEQLEAKEKANKAPKTEKLDPRKRIIIGDEKRSYYEDM